MPFRIFHYVKIETEKLLNYLGQRLQLDIFYFLRGGIWLSGSYAVIALLSFLITVAFSHLATKEFYGQYRFILSILGILSALALPAMNVAIIQSVTKGKERSLIPITKVRFAWSLLGSAILILLAGFFKYIKPVSFWQVFLVSAICFPFLNSFDGYLSFFIGKKKFEKTAIYHVAVQLAASLAVIIVLFFAPNLSLIITAFLITTALLNVLFYYNTIRAGLRGNDPAAIHYGAHLSFMDMFRIATSYIDQLIVTYFLGFEQLAVYAIAISIPNAFQDSVKSASPMLFPKFAALKGTRIYQQIKTKILYALIISAFAALIGILLSPIFIPILFSKQYTVAVPFAQLMFLAVITAPTATILASLLKARKKVRGLYYHNTLSTIVTIASLLILIPLYGLWGAILARIVTQYSVTIQLWLLSRKA